MVNALDVVCLGELLLRLSAPGAERLLQSPRFDIAIGGAEANVAVSLARFGHHVRLASVVSDNDLGSVALGEVAKHGVGISEVVRVAGRMGIYFLAPGAVTRPSQVLYDRANSAFATRADALKPEAVLEGAAWLHVSGVTPAIGATASKATIDMVEAAARGEVQVSFDGNYRGQMWAAWQGDGPAILRQILATATIAFINERDLDLILGQDFKSRELAYQAAFDTFPKLQWIAATTRTLASVSQQSLGAELVSRTGRWTSRTYELIGIIDRIGGGDAFAAGVLHGLIGGRDPQYCIDFGAAAGAIKHSIPGDFNLTSIAEIEATMTQGGLDVRR
jgi:2-dehydro-3-deoxygluconokinase